MVDVKLQERISKQGRNDYFTYVITLPKSIVEALPELMKSKRLKITLDKGKIVLTPKNIGI